MRWLQSTQPKYQQWESYQHSPIRSHYLLESLLGAGSFEGRGFFSGLELFRLDLPRLDLPRLDFSGLDIPRLMRKNFIPLRNELATLIFFDLFRPSNYRSPGLLAADGTGPVAAGAPNTGVVEKASPRKMLSAAGGSGLSAFASSTLTCQISVLVNCVLKSGIPVKRMPLATFQYVSPGGSSLTPTTLPEGCFSQSGGADGNMFSPMGDGLPW
jgi:hypothetical protein